MITKTAERAKETKIMIMERYQNEELVIIESLVLLVSIHAGLFII